MTVQASLKMELILIDRNYKYKSNLKNEKYLYNLEIQDNILNKSLILFTFAIN
jgi:hypothetical protein